MGTTSLVCSNQNSGQRGQHSALVGDGVRKDDVERRDPVARHHQQPVVTDLVDVANLALGVQVGENAHAALLTSSFSSRANTAVEVLEPRTEQIVELLLRKAAC